MRINVVDPPYHARSSGSLDQTYAQSNMAGIQRAIWDIEKAGGGEIYIPGGNYVLAHTLATDPNGTQVVVTRLMIQKQSVNIRGDGHASVLTGPYNGQVMEVSSANPNSPGDCAHIHLSHFCIERYNSAPRVFAGGFDDNDIGLQVLHANDVVVENLELQYHSKCILVGYPTDSGIPAQFVRLNECVIQRFDQAGIIFFRGADNRVSGGQIMGFKRPGPSSPPCICVDIRGGANAIYLDHVSIISQPGFDYGVRCEGDDPAHGCFAIGITGCNIEGARHQDIFLAAYTDMVTIAGGWLASGENGILMNPGIRQVTVKGVLIHGHRGPGIRCFQVNHVTLVGNVLRDCGKPAIELSGTNNQEVGNVIS